MSPVIDFRQSPLSPFLGKWMLDPLSVSRNKVVKRALGGDGLKRLWACASMEERAECLAADSELAQRYDSVLGLGRKSHLVVTLKALTWDYAQSGSLPAKTRVYPIVKVAVEARKVIVHGIDSRPELRGRAVCFVFRMSKRWLLVSERYSGRNAQYFPRSPVFRYCPSTDTLPHSDLNRPEMRQFPS